MSLIQLRLLSVVFALLATIALDRLWLKHAPRTPAGMVSGAVDLLGVPAALLPHGAILQPAGFGIRRRVLGGVAMEPGVRFVETAADLGRIAGGAALHALRAGNRGLGRRERVAVAAARASARRVCWRETLIVLAAYLPWLVTLASVLAVWRAKPGLLLLTGNRVLEWGDQAGLLDLFVLLWRSDSGMDAAGDGATGDPGRVAAMDGSSNSCAAWIFPAAVTALIGFAGVAGWVSYAFGPARLLFLLPLAVLAIAAGAYSSPRAGSVIAGALLAANLVGIGSYFQARDLLNIGYLAPMDRIARDIAGSSSPADTLVLVDGPNLSGVVLEYYLPGFSTRQIFTAEDAAAARREIDQSGYPACVVAAQSSRCHARACFRATGKRSAHACRYKATLHPYVAFSATHKAILRAANIQISSDLMYAAWEFQKAN